MKTLFLAISILCISCGKLKSGYDIYKVPHTTYFVIKRDNHRLPDSILDNMKMSYYQAGSKKYVTDFGRAIDENGSTEARESGIQVTRNIGFSSSKEGIKDYYLEYPNNTRDTLYVDYNYLDDDDAYNDPCKCNYPFRAIQFNGQVPGIDSLYKFARVYILNKR